MYYLRNKKDVEREINEKERRMSEIKEEFDYIERTKIYSKGIFYGVIMGTIVASTIFLGFPYLFDKQEPDKPKSSIEERVESKDQKSKKTLGDEF